MDSGNKDKKNFKTNWDVAVLKFLVVTVQKSIQKTDLVMRYES